jgi:hypothetical protein
MIRDIIVTHARNSNATEKELESLATLMGHSVQIQRSVYDKRTKVQKIAPAFDLIKKFNKN